MQLAKQLGSRVAWEGGYELQTFSSSKSSYKDTPLHTHSHPEEQFYRYLTLSNERIVQQRTRAVISLERYFLHPEVRAMWVDSFPRPCG